MYVTKQTKVSLIYKLKILKVLYLIENVENIKCEERENGQKKKITEPLTAKF